MVGMCDSVHLARWISQFKGTGYRFVVFPSTPHRHIHRTLKEQFVRGSSGFITMRRIDRHTALIFGLVDLLIGRRLQSARLRRLLTSGEFDAVHLLETQHAGYLYLAAASKRMERIPVALSIWGSDLVWFRSSRRHVRRLVDTLKLVDHIFVECVRDVKIAQSLGFRGTSSKPVSAGGGVSLSSELHRESNNTPPSLRQAIVLKGYTGFVGKADVGIAAIVANKSLLSSFHIYVYSCGLLTILKLRLLRYKHGLEFRAFRKKSLTQDQVLNLFRASRVSLAVSLTDGLPGSFREAAWTGAFPIESIGSCIAEWAVPNEQVILIDPTSVDAVSNGLREALLNGELVDRAQILNLQVAEKFTIETTRETAVKEYRKFVGRRLL